MSLQQAGFLNMLFIVLSASWGTAARQVEPTFLVRRWVASVHLLAIHLGLESRDILKVMRD